MLILSPHPHTATDPSELLKQQQELVNQRLGLDFAAAVGVDVQGIVSKDDLSAAVTEKQDQDSRSGNTPNGQAKARSVSQVTCLSCCLSIVLCMH